MARPARDTEGQLVSEHRTLLGQLLAEMDLSYEAAIQRFERVGRELNETISVSPRQFSRWVNAIGKSGPHPTARRVLRQMFDVPAHELLGPPKNTRAPAGSDEHSLKIEGMPLDLESPTAILARARGALATDSAALDHVGLAVGDIVDCYELEGPRSLVGEMVILRKAIEELLDIRMSAPTYQRAIEHAARSAGILAYAATNLGRFQTARAYSLEAFMFASAASRKDLQAWVRATQSLTEYYAGRPRESLELARDGQRYAASGPESVRLAVNGEARCLATMPG